jgi:regulator of protease activity HflC (stomatin/prohibitin superfamily)
MMRMAARRTGLAAGVVVALVLTAIFLAQAFARVQPGYVGIRVNNIGPSAGVVSQPLPVGWYFAPPGTNIYEYPVFTRTYTWTKSTTEQSPIDESFSFQDKNGLGLSADVAVAYHVDASRAPILFQRYRSDMDAIIAGPLRNAIRNAIVERASQLGVEEIYGPHKSELISTALRQVQRYFAPVGLQVEQLYWAGNIIVPDAVLQQINAKIANEQAALAAQANVATAKADADARIAKAEGDAKAIQVEAEAIRTNPEIVKLRAVERWDGKLPSYTGAGPVPFVDVK